MMPPLIINLGNNLNSQSTTENMDNIFYFKNMGRKKNNVQIIVSCKTFF